LLLVTIGKCFPSVWEILPSAFGVGQYFPNIGETISNRDLNTSHYLYIVPLAVHIKREAMAACFDLKLNSHWVQTTGGHTKIKQVLSTTISLCLIKTSQPSCWTGVMSLEI